MINRIGNSSYNRVKDKLVKIGYSINPLIFMYMRLVSSLLIFVILLFTIDYGYLIAPIVTVLYYVFVEIVILDISIKKRTIELENDALEFMPIFMLSMKSGRSIKKSLSYATDIIDNSLSREFKKVLNDEKIGKSLDEALMSLKNRIPSDFVINMIVSIVETNRLGNSINDSIDKQLSYIDGKRKRKILNSYKIIPFKLAIISVVFVLIVILLLTICSI